MLRLRRGTVREARDADGPEQHLVVEVDGAPRAAIADVGLVGRSERGDDVVVNVEAVELGLGSGGFDVVHVNLTRGLGAEGTPGAHVMKLNYTSLQHAVAPVEEGGLARDRGAAGSGEFPEHDAGAVTLDRPVAVLALHGQLAPLAWAAGRARPGTRLGYVQTAGGALPGGHSRTVRELRGRGLLAGHLTAGAAFGGEAEAITTAGALAQGLGRLGWDAVAVGPGPGILGSGSALGHGGLVALDSAHAALALGCRTLMVARMSSTDPRPRHRGLSHHTRTVLDLLLAPVTVAVPGGQRPRPVGGPAERPDGPRHHWVQREEAALEDYLASGLPARSMGRDDPLFFASALVSGRVLAEMILPT